MDADISLMVGKIFVAITPAKKGSEELTFTEADGTAFTFYHDQDCCEGVEIDDVCGDLADLIGSPLLVAEVQTSDLAETVDPFTQTAVKAEYPDSQTWTFYKFATIKGSVTVRWFGSSNGYYSEGVDLKISTSA